MMRRYRQSRIGRRLLKLENCKIKLFGICYFRHHISRFSDWLGHASIKVVKLVQRQLVKVERGAPDCIWNPEICFDHKTRIESCGSHKRIWNLCECCKQKLNQRSFVTTWKFTGQEWLCGVFLQSQTDRRWETVPYYRNWTSVYTFVRGCASGYYW